jgi:GT2 family glycosyltransferase
MSGAVTVVSATRASADQFARATYLGRSLTRFPAANLPRISVRPGNGTGDSAPHGLPQIYNSVIEAADADDILVFVHDDVYLHDWFLPQRLTEAVEHWDVVGIAGSANPDLNSPSWGLNFDADLRPTTFQEGLIQSGVVNHHDYGAPEPFAFGPTPMQCELLDGLFLAVRAGTLHRTGVRFDTRFQFHLYDIDFCRSCRAAGLTLGTWPIAVTHESAGNYGTESFRVAAHMYLEKWSSGAGSRPS